MGLEPPWSVRTSYRFSSRSPLLWGTEYPIVLRPVRQGQLQRSQECRTWLHGDDPLARQVIGQALWQHEEAHEFHAFLLGCLRPVADQGLQRLGRLHVACQRLCVATRLREDLDG